jgi:hypothetical protein
MGTDVYLYWNEQTQAEKEKQYAGFSINAGDKGYLRASIGMHEENAVLRNVFPAKFWNPDPKGDWTEDQWENFKGFEYNFEKNIELLKESLKAYLLNKALPKPKQKKDKVLEAQSEMHNTITEIFKRMGATIASEETSKDEEKKYKAMWAKSVMEFFKLGLELQESGLRPRVYISW